MSLIHTVSKFARQDWVSACQFHDLTQSEVLEEVANRVRSTANPLVLLDLDSTLYEVEPRSHQILGEWSRSLESDAYPLFKEALQEALEHHIGYSIRDTFHALELYPHEEEFDCALESAKRFWGKRFFSSAYLKYDRPYPGAVSFVKRVYDLGAQIIYLSGRDEPGMGKGTREKLRYDGFPWDVPRTHLLLKEASHHLDLEHKTNAAHYIRRQGALIASFENEPPNVAALHALFPESMHVFVETVCSEHEAVACLGLYRIQDFSLL